MSIVNVSDRATIYELDGIPGSAIVGYPRYEQTHPSRKGKGWDGWGSPPGGISPGVGPPLPYAYRPRDNKDDRARIHLAVFDHNLRTRPSSYSYKWSDTSTYEVQRPRGKHQLITHVLPLWYWRWSCGTNVSTKFHPLESVEALGEPVPLSEWIENPDAVCARCWKVFTNGLQPEDKSFWRADPAWRPEAQGHCERCQDLGIIVPPGTTSLNPLRRDYHEHCPDCFGKLSATLRFDTRNTPHVHAARLDLGLPNPTYVASCRPRLETIYRGEDDNRKVAEARAAIVVPRGAAITCFKCRVNPYGSNGKGVTCDKCGVPMSYMTDGIQWYTTCEHDTEPTSGRWPGLKRARGATFIGNYTQALSNYLSAL